MTYHLILLLLLVIQIRDLTTGHHTMIVFNSKLPTSCFVVIRCLPGISTSCSTSGPHLLPSTMMNPHSLTLQICIIPLILLPLVTSPGNLLVYSIMVCSLWKGFHCHAPIFWLCEPAGFPQESNMQIRKSLKGDDYFKQYRPLMAIVENHGECTIPFGNPHDSAHSNL